MTVKAKEVIWDAYEDLLNRSSEEPVEAEDALAGIRYLNDMMTMEDARGMSLGYTVVSKISDTITVAAGAIAWMKASLTIFMSAKFDVDVKPSVVKREKDGREAALNLASLSPGERSFPSDLPMGSGNTQYGSSAFFPDSNNGVYTELNGPILTEDDTEED